MKDNECKAFIHTYKCNEKNCEGCKNRYMSNSIIDKLNKLAIETDEPIYKGDIIEDYSVNLSDVLEIVKNIDEMIKENYISNSTLECIIWERDVVIAQLNELGYSFGQEVGWISCKNRLPEEEGEYLVTLNNGIVTFAGFRDVKNYPHFNAPVKAWQPLPKKYEGE